MAFCEAVAEIDLNALKSNLRQVLNRIGQRKIIAVVKADAYGHGSVPIARCLIETSSQIVMLGVASLDEALCLRNAHIDIPLLVMTGCPADGIPDLVRYRLIPAVHDEVTFSSLSRYAKKTDQILPVHLKVDTGMGRLGIRPEEAVGFIQKALKEGLRVEGLFSHFAEADLADLSYAREQMARFKAIVEFLKKAQGGMPLCHMANSAAILTFPDAHLDAVRPGLMLYGYSPMRTLNPLPLMPVLTLKGRILSLKKVDAGVSISYGRTFVTKRPTKIAVVAIGYADGYPRLLSNQGEMLVQGTRAPVIGRVCMDMTMLDVTEAPSVCVGDWVTVLGKEGNEAIGADDLAEKTNTIPYEILCRIDARIPRVYR